MSDIQVRIVASDVVAHVMMSHVPSVGDVINLECGSFEVNHARWHVYDSTKIHRRFVVLNCTDVSFTFQPEVVRRDQP